MDEFEIGDTVRFMDGLEDQGELIGVFLSKEPPNYKVDTPRGVRWTTHIEKGETKYDRLSIVEKVNKG